MPDTPAPKRKATSATRRGTGAGMGDGHGGVAKGRGVAGKAPQFTPETAPAANAASRLSDRAEIRATRTAALEDRLFALAEKAEREETSVTAARALHAIYNGTPVARAEIGGPDGGPIPTRVEYAWADPPTPETAKP